MRIATWNVNSIGARLPRLLDWLQTRAPDVVCLQETKIADEKFPAAAIAECGYETAAFGLGAWNGVAILSRVGLDEVTRGLTNEAVFEVPEARAVGATCGGVRVWSVYVPNGRSPDNPHYEYKLRWLAGLAETMAIELADGDRPFVITGDFNIAPTDADVWDPAAFASATHVTPPEREALARLRDLGLRDIVPRPMKYDKPFTYWDYRAGMFHKNMGMRIDLVYVNQALADSVVDAHVDRDARKGTGPSDHAPIIVDTAVRGAADHVAGGAAVSSA